MTFRRQSRRIHKHTCIAAVLTAALLSACSDDAEPVYTDPDMRQGARTSEPQEAAPFGLVDTETERTQSEPRDGTAGQARAQIGGASARGAVEVSLVTSTQGDVRVGQPFEYRIVLQNISNEPVHGVSVSHHLPPSFELLDAEPRGMQPERLSGGARGNAGEAAYGRERLDARPREASAPRDRSQEASGQQQSRTGEQQQQDPQSRQQNPQSQQRGEQSGQQSGEWQGPANQPRREGDARTRPMTWSIGKLEAGESREITVNGVLTEEGAFDACVTVAYDPAVCMQIAAVKPELRLERLVESEYAFICDDIRILYRVTNEGSGETTAITLREELPEGFQTIEGERQVDLQLPPLAAGETAEEIVVVRAQREGELRGRATASTDMAEVRSNESVVRVFEPALELRVSAQEQQYVGRPVNIHVEVTNTSTSPVTQAEISWQPPAQGRRFTVSGGARTDGDTLLVGNLQPGEVRRFDIGFESAQPGEIEAVFVAQAHCVEPQEQRAMIRVEGIEAVGLELIDLGDPVAIDGEMAYEVRVKNQGTAASINVRLTAELPQELEFVSADGDSRVTNEGQQLRFAPIPELPPGEVATWRVIARANEAGKVRFRVELMTDATDEPVYSIEPTTVY